MRCDMHSPFGSDSRSCRSSHVRPPRPLMWRVHSCFVAMLTFAVGTVGDRVSNLNICMHAARCISACTWITYLRPTIKASLTAVVSETPP